MIVCLRIKTRWANTKSFFTKAVPGEEDLTKRDVYSFDFFTSPISAPNLYANISLGGIFDAKMKQINNNKNT